MSAVVMLMDYPVLLLPMLAIAGVLGWESGGVQVVDMEASYGLGVTVSALVVFVAGIVAGAALALLFSPTEPSVGFYQWLLLGVYLSTISHMIGWAIRLRLRHSTPHEQE